MTVYQTVKGIRLDGTLLMMCCRWEAETHDFHVFWTWGQEDHPRPDDLVVITHLTFGDLITLTFLKDEVYDVAVPQAWFEQHFPHSRLVHLKTHELRFRAGEDPPVIGHCPESQRGSLPQTPVSLKN